MYLKPETIKNIEQTIGLPIEVDRNMDLDEEIKYIENKNKKKLTWPKNVDHRMISHSGNPLITRRRFRTMEDVDKKLDKIIKDK